MTEKTTETHPRPTEPGVYLYRPGDGHKWRVFGLVRYHNGDVVVFELGVPVRVKIDQFPGQFFGPLDLDEVVRDHSALAILRSLVITWDEWFNRHRELGSPGAIYADHEDAIEAARVHLEG